MMFSENISMEISNANEWRVSNIVLYEYNDIIDLINLMKKTKQTEITTKLQIEI